MTKVAATKLFNSAVAYLTEERVKKFAADNKVVLVNALKSSKFGAADHVKVGIWFVCLYLG